MRKILVCVSIVFIITAACAQGSVPAKIFGELSVSPSGAAVYRVPISVPPGVTGMEPKLALLYNSQNGNGPLGMGWSLDGLSAITRCPKTIAADGVKGALTHTPDDRFCMDGQRLINIAGTYGAPGSEYRTEIESFSKIVANGAAAGNYANGPQSFTVKTKAGLTLEYGSTEDSRIEAQGKSVVRVWALGKMLDAKGNEVSYNYEKNTSSGEFNIAFINYSGGGRIDFRYDDRSDSLVRYEMVSPIAQARRIRQIITGVGGVDHRSLFIGYASDAMGDISLLSKIDDCDARTALCLSPLYFQYGDLSVDLKIMNFGEPSPPWMDEPIFDQTDRRFSRIFPGGSPVLWERNVFTHKATRFNPDGTMQKWSWQGHGVGSDGWELADLFGDGHQVYWTRSGLTHYATRLNSDGTVQNWSWQGHGTGSDGWQIADLFGDGREVYWTRSGLTHYATRLNPDGTVQNWSWQGHGTGNDGWQLANLFGDGRKVYWTRSGLTHYATRLNPDGTVQNWSWQGHGTGSDGWQLADLFGDGREVYWTKSGLTHYATRLNPDGTVQNWSWQGHGTGSERVWQLVDLFGDGRKVYWTKSGFTHYATRLNPDGTVKNWSWQGHGIGSIGYFKFVDLFGDGHQVYWTRTDKTHFVTRLNPDGSSRNWTLDGPGPLSIHSDFVDVLGNGVQAFWSRQGSSEASVFGFFSSGEKNKLVKIDGSDSVSIDYSSFPGEVNSLGGRVYYPVFSMPVPVGTVRSVRRNDGLNGESRVLYWFGGMKAEHASQENVASGSRSLGFQWMRSHEQATGVDSYTEFAQSWPYAGRPLKMETRVLKGVNVDEWRDVNRVLQIPWIKQSEINIGCYQTESAVNREKPSVATFGCELGPGRIYFLFSQKNIERSRDINGMDMPVVSTVGEYAGYADQSGVVRQFGDPTQITVDISDGGGVRQRKVTANQYQPARIDGVNWQSGRLNKAVVTSLQY